MLDLDLPWELEAPYIVSVRLNILDTTRITYMPQKT